MARQCHVDPMTPLRSHLWTRRGLTITLDGISVSIVLATACMYWIAWPDWTAETFASLMIEGDFDGGTEMMTADSQLSTHWELTTQAILCEAGMHFEVRSIGDAIRGRRRFRIGRSSYEYAASMGRVRRAYQPSTMTNPAAKRPALVHSIDLFNEGPAGLVIVLPVTCKAKGIPFHVAIDPPEGGVKTRSFIK